MFIMQITHLRLSPIAAEELSKSKYDEVQRWLKSWTCLNNYEAVVGETYDEALLKKRPLDFMAYWDSVDTGADVLGLVANMAPGYRAVMWEQAREAQSRVCRMIGGNVIQFSFA